MTTHSSEYTPSQPRPIHAILAVTTIDGAPATLVLEHDEVGHSMAATPSPAGFGQLMAIAPDSLPRLKGTVKHIHNAVEKMLSHTDTVSSPGVEESPPVAIHVLTEQEANLVRLLRTCHAHRTASKDDLDDFLRADALARLVVELLDGYTVEFIQAVFTEATEIIQKTTVFSTATLAYQEHREQVDLFHSQWLDHKSAAKG